MKRCVRLIFLLLLWPSSFINPAACGVPEQRDLAQDQQAIYPGLDTINVMKIRDKNLINCASLAAIEGVEKYLNLGADADATDHFGITSLMISSCLGYLPIVDILISRGANVNYVDPRGNTALMIAVQQGRCNIVNHLLLHGATANIKNLKEDVPLLEAARLGYRPIVGMLLQAGAEVNITNTDGDSPLSCSIGREDIYADLLQAGADPRILKRARNRAIDIYRLLEGDVASMSL